MHYYGDVRVLERRCDAAYAVAMDAPAGRSRVDPKVDPYSPRDHDASLTPRRYSVTSCRASIHFRGADHGSI